MGESVGRGEGSGRQPPTPGSSPSSQSPARTVSGETGFEEEFGHRSSVRGAHSGAAIFQAHCLSRNTSVFTYIPSEISSPSRVGDCRASQVGWEDTGHGGLGEQGCGGRELPGLSALPSSENGPVLPSLCHHTGPYAPSAHPKPQECCLHVTTILTMTPSPEVPRGPS